ncbi:MAG: class I SAM-dependent methyltransferase [Lachnospiraceae bacterium]|nr:class I SAM-dependent methyltransferase [Lachnospiraceae bacterium]
MEDLSAFFVKNGKINTVGNIYRAENRELRPITDADITELEAYYYVENNSRIWDERSENSDQWSIPVTTEVIDEARKGNWSIVLTPVKPVPRDWFPEDMRGKRILCLASGGGQQGPVLAATGADVTVYDNSKGQLEKDAFVAKRDGLTIKTVQGNMQDLSMFADASFDVIVHPWSNNYVDDIQPVWRECARVLKKGGVLMAGFGSPLEYIFDIEKFEKGILEPKYSIPYADIDHLDDPKVKEIAESEGFSWGHTLEEQIQGQISAGFVIAGFYEDRGCALLDKYINTSMATKALKC